MDDLLLWLLVLGALAWTVTLRRRRRGASSVSSEEESARGVVQRYQRLDGARLGGSVSQRLMVAGLPRGSWEAVALEELPQPSRRRLALTVALSEEALSVGRDRLEALAWTLAGRLQSATAAHVVVVEAYGGGSEGSGATEPALSLLFAPDGRGWTGEDRGLIGALGGAGQVARSLTLGEVQGRLHATLDVAAREL